MNSIKTLYKLMEVSSRDLEIPDAYQRKLNTERVAKIVAGFNERIANEPKVSFRDGHYYVFDGQHTIVARKHMNGNNDLPILCKVYYGMTEADEALLFAMQTGYSAALTPSARLRANLRGEDKASGEFYEATEDVGFHVGFERGGGVGRIICINTAFAEFKRVGAEIYKEALTLLLEAWGGDPDSLRAEVIQGIFHFVELYHGEYDRERLIYSLRAYEPKFIYAAGKAEKELRGVKRYVNLFYRIYNGRRKHSTLPMKFGPFPSKRTVQKSTSCCRIETTTGGAVMSRQYTKVEMLSEEVFRRKAAGETNREIGAHFGLSKAQIKELVKRQNRKQRLIANGHAPQPKGRPRKSLLNEEQKRDKELVELRMQVELLRNFLSEVGRR